MEWCSTCGHLVEHRAAGVDIAAWADIFALEVFRCDIRQSSTDSSGGSVAGGDGRCAGFCEILCQAEIHDLQAAIGRITQVCRLQVAVNDASLMSSFKALRHLRAQTHDFLFLQWTGGQLVIQRDSGNQFCDKEVSVLLRIEVVDGFDIRMVEPGKGQCFLA